MKSIYCESCNIREVLIVANFARRTNSRIQESREKYLYNSVTKEKWKFANPKLRENSKSDIHENWNTRKLPGLQ